MRNGGAVSSATRRCTRAAAVASAVVAGVLLTGLPMDVASADPGTEPPLLTVNMAAAAADGAGHAVTEAMAQTVVSGMMEIGRLAAAVQPPVMPPKPTVKPPPPPKVVVPSGPLLTWRGWQSGAAGEEARNGTFGAWRGEPLGVIGVWCDTTEQAQTDMTAVDRYAAYLGDMDVAVGGLVKGETWQQAATGAFTQRWTTAVRNLRVKRLGKGTTYIRIAHEMNGQWFDWSVNSANVAAYKQAYRLYASIIRKEFPEARLTWSPNGGNHADISIDAMWPGDDVVDVIGPDIYDGWPTVDSPAAWRKVAAMWTDPQSPRGLAAWQIYAKRKNKPFAVPEWGLPYGDHPEFIKGVHAVLLANRALKGKVPNAGRAIYDIYYNVENKFKIYNGPLTQSGAAYKKLTWGS
jgi:Glycosyl hydrolase family 26